MEEGREGGVEEGGKAEIRGQAAQFGRFYFAQVFAKHIPAGVAGP